MTPLVVPTLVFVAALLAASLLTVAAWWLWRHADGPAPRVAERPYLRIVRDPAPTPAPLDWRDYEDGGSAA